MEFTLDKETFYNAFLDNPYNLMPERKEIFDNENPFWVNFLHKNNQGN